MRRVVDLAAFQGVWFAAVLGAAGGRPWLGPAALGLWALVHGAALPGWAERRRTLGFALGVGLLGFLLDSGLRALGLLRDLAASGAWGPPLAPPWIVALWMAFALLPRHALAWLRGRDRTAALLGAVGGPLSFLAGTRTGAVAPGDPQALAWGLLALEYALVTPLLLRWAPREEA